MSVDAGRKTAVLEAAIEYVLEHGLSDLSLRPLAAALGTSGRMLIYYFGSKDQLIIDILNEVRLRKEADIEAAGEERGLRAYWDWAMSPPGIRYLRLVYEVYGLSLHEPERFAAFLSAESRDVLEFIGRGLRADGVPEAQVEALSTYTFAALRGLEIDVLTTGERVRADLAYEMFEEDLDGRIKKPRT
jgi:AcrR family transcriptional regulator